MEDKYNLLKEHIEKVVVLTEDEFDLVKACFIQRQYRKSECIFREGDTVNYIYFVLSGLLKFYYTDDDAKQHIVSFAMEDWWETDVSAFYTRRNASFTLECLENTELLCLSLENFERLCNRLQKMERFFLRKSIAGHIGSQQRILSFLTSGAKERYEQLIKRNPALLQRIPKLLLASYLGVSRETLSRLFS
ncbi:MULTISPECIES: Crp/Fnr family transcriptional regulator [Sphingobacterium]|uniref:Crp/Fnr family transcriptional regulator n=1 Tax=Sphingobacterium TaxID=28453 RepID=UPI000ED07E99|nr:MULTISPECIES: Crp/Fnr family transcriptional regulator [Sphingobacterium]HAK28704.1 Crp/Fnr family transcriptional regulator [Sphingobacterium sp.]